MIKDIEWDFYDGDYKCRAALMVGNVSVTVWGDNLDWDCITINEQQDIYKERESMEYIGIVTDGKCVPLKQVLEHYFNTYGQMKAEYDRDAADDNNHVTDLRNLRLMGRV